METEKIKGIPVYRKIGRNKRAFEFYAIIYLSVNKYEDIIMEAIDKDGFLAWVSLEKQKILDTLSAKGKEVSSSKTPRDYERMKMLEAVEAAAAEYTVAIQQEDGLAAVRKYLESVARRRYYDKLSSFYSKDGGVGNAALSRASELRRQGLSYKDVADELELEGFKTVNGHGRWSPAQLRRSLIKYGFEKNEQNN